MAGVEEYRDVGALRLLAEIEQPLRHLVAGEIGAFDHFEPDIAQCAGDGFGVDRRIRQRRHVLVGAVTDDEGDPAVGLRRTDGERHADQGEQEGEVAHRKCPCRIEKSLTGTFDAKIHEKAALRATKIGPFTTDLVVVTAVQSLAISPLKLRDLDHKQQRRSFKISCSGFTGGGR